MQTRCLHWFLVGAAALAAPELARPQEARLDTGAIEQALGLSGKMGDGVFRVTRPRGELHVTVDGFPITPPMGLTAWMAFRPHGQGAMLMGDIPLAEDEIQPVLSALMEGGVEVSALHNHFVRDQPHVMFLHVGGMGDPVKLARGLRAALDVLGRKGAPGPATELHSDLDVKKLDSVLGASGEFKDGVYKVTVPRPQVQLKDMGVDVNSAMGFNSWAAFQGTMDRAAAAGDFVMLTDEVNPIVRELRRANLEVVAIHNHMLHEEPRVFFLHFWGVGRAEDLAHGVRSALDQMGKAAGSPGGK
jgi:uncharacterized protein DUF1259